jgi:hypothetical protein
MAYDDYLNKDAFKGGVLDAPDLTVRIAQAKIAAGAAQLLTTNDWKRLAQRQSLEQQSYKLASTPTASEQATAQRRAMDQRLPRFTQQELMQANMPGTVPAEQEFRVRNIPGRGEMTVVNGVEIRGGPRTKDMAELPVPEEGYGYIQTPTGYLSTTPYGMERGAQPVLGDTLATGTALEDTGGQLSAAPSGGSRFEQELAKPPVQLQSPQAPKTIEELLPSLRGTPARANEAVADWMRGTFYGATNIVRPSMWESVTTPKGAAAAIYQPQKSDAYFGQLQSRLDALSDKSAPAAVRLQNEINQLTSISPRTGLLTSDALGISTMRAPKVSPELVANQLLGTPAPTTAAPTAPTASAAPSPTTVQAVLPPPMQPSPEMEMSQVEQQFAMPEAAAPRGLADFVPAQAPQTYRPPQFTAPRFDPSRMMSQPSASETLGGGQALRQYQIETKAQLDAYKANVAAQRNAVRDQLDAQLKTAQINRAQLGAIGDAISNQFAAGGPQYGTFTVGDKTRGYIRTGPKSLQTFDIEKKASATEQNFEFRSKVNAEIAKSLKSGNREAAANMFQSLGGRLEDFALLETLVGQEGGAAAQPAAKSAAGGAKQLSREQAQALLVEAGNNKDRARQLAAERGFKF